MSCACKRDCKRNLEDRLEYLKKYEKIKLIGHCYIYPNGGCAKRLLRILKAVYLGVEFIGIDDREEASSFERYKEEIKTSQKYVLLMGGDIYEELERKCLESGVQKLIDSREYVAYLLGREILKLAAGGGGKFALLENRILHLYEEEWIRHYYYFYDLFIYYCPKIALEELRQCVLQYCQVTQRHLERAGYSLELQKGIMLDFAPHTLEISSFISDSTPIAWYFGSMEYYLEHQHKVGNQPILIAPWVIADYFVNYEVTLKLSGGMPRLNPKQRKVVGMGHSLAEAFGLSPRNVKKKNLMQYAYYYFVPFSHYCALDRESHKAFVKIFKAISLEIEVCKSGSPRLDYKIQNKKPCHCPIKQFLFIPRLMMAEDLKGAILFLLEKGKKVVFRPHPALKSYVEYMGSGNPYAALEEFCNYPHFSFDLSGSLSSELLVESIVVTDNSSVSYSTPLSVCKPVILYAFPKKEFDLRITNFDVSFANPKLHRVALNLEEFKRESLQLESDLKTKGRQVLEELEQYQRKEIYHLGKSSKWIANFLENILKEA